MLVPKHWGEAAGAVDAVALMRRDGVAVPLWASARCVVHLIRAQVSLSVWELAGRSDGPDADGGATRHAGRPQRPRRCLGAGDALIARATSASRAICAYLATARAIEKGGARSTCPTA